MDCKSTYETNTVGQWNILRTLPGRWILILCGKTAVLSDVNFHLVETYRMVKDRPLEVMAALEHWSNDERSYYNVRETEYTDPIQRVAQFIYPELAGMVYIASTD